MHREQDHRDPRRDRAVSRPSVGARGPGTADSRRWPRASRTPLRAIRALAVAAAVLALALTLPRPGFSMCCPFPPDGSVILSSGQLNLVVMHRDRGEIELVPNILVVGEPVAFSLVVPTPSFPAMAPVAPEIWAEAAALTVPVSRQRINSNGGFGCYQTDVFSPAASDGTSSENGGVVVHEERTVGAFVATILSSDDAGALVRWLEDNDFEISSAQEQNIEPLTRAGWFFTAMKLDTTQVSIPAGGWETTVDPVSFTYRADQLQVPLAFLSINRGSNLPMRFYVVDEHRTTLSGFNTSYANRVSASEMRAMDQLHPALADFLGAGVFLTRLDRSFGRSDPMSETLVMQRAANDEEFRPTWDTRILLGLAHGLPGHLLGFVGIAALLGALARRGPRTAPR